MNWQQEAQEAADYVSLEMFKAHRGAMNWRNTGVFLVFGNDGYSRHERAQKEVEFMREFLRLANATELAFAVDAQDEYSWVLLVSSDQLNSDILNAAVWAGWSVAQGDSAYFGSQALSQAFASVQAGIARGVMGENEQPNFGSLN